MKEYGEGGFIPTIDGTRQHGDTLVLETIDPKQGSNLVSKPDHEITRAHDAEFLTEQQERSLELEDLQSA